MNVSDKALLESRTKVLEIVALDALRRSGKSEALEGQPIVRRNRKELGTVTAFYTVVALFQIAAPGALSIFRERLGTSLGALANALSLEDKVVPPNFRVLRWSVNRHANSPFAAFRPAGILQDRGHTRSELHNYACMSQGGLLAISGGRSRRLPSGQTSET